MGRRKLDKGPGRFPPLLRSCAAAQHSGASGNHPLSANLAFFKAYQFLRHGNPGQALAEADRLAAQTANLQSSDYRQFWLENLGDLYLTCGKIKLAESWYSQLSDEGEKQAELDDRGSPG